MKTINTLRKVSLATLLTFGLSFSSVFAQNDIMYIMKSGAIVGQYNVNTEVDSVIFYKPTIEETTSGTFIDSRDGNEYNWVQIGDQVWMAENLKYLPSVVGPSANSIEIPYYYVYGYDGTNVSSAKASSNHATYGVLYNWTAACSSCPAGWHLPSDAEWTSLQNYLIANGYNYDATTTDNKIAKALAAKTDWNTSTTTGAIGNDLTLNNSTGFSALPGGYRSNAGSFKNLGYYGFWWSATESSTDNAWHRYLHYSSTNLISNNYYVKQYGFSVRCVRD